MRKKLSSILEFTFFIVFNIYSMLVLTALGSNLTIQKNENLSQIVIDATKHLNAEESSTFINYEINNFVSWTPDVTPPPLNIVAKAQNDFLPEEVITNAYYLPTPKSFPFYKDESGLGDKYAVITAPSVEYLGLAVIAGNAAAPLLLANRISISQELADQLLLEPEYSSLTYSDLIDSDYHFYSSSTGNKVKNSYKITSIFRSDANAKVYSNLLDNKFIIASTMTTLPGTFGINFKIVDKNVATMQRLFAFINAYLKVSKNYYNIAYNKVSVVTASVVDDTQITPLLRFNKVYNYYKTRQNILFSVIMLLFVPFFVSSFFSVSKSLAKRSKFGVRLTLLSLFSYSLTIYIIGAVRILNFDFALIYLPNYYSFILISLFLIGQLIYIKLAINKIKKMASSGPMDGKPVIIQQIPNRALSSGLTKDLDNMMKSESLNKKYDFMIVDSSKKRPLSMILDYKKSFENSNACTVLIRGAGIESLWPTIAAKLTKKHTIVAIHGMWSDLHYIGRIKKWISLNIIEPLILSLCDEFYTVYDGAMNKRNLQNYKDKYSGTIYNPISMNDEGKNNKSSKRIPNIKKDDIVGLFVGRINREKGIQTILDSLHTMSKYDNHYNFKMLFVGDGPDIGYFKSIARNNNLGDVVTFIGEKSDVDIYYRRSDFIVFPSLHENMPMAILEAVNHKKYIISTNVGGISEILTTNIGYKFFEPNNANQLTSILKKTLESKIYKKEFPYLTSEVADKFSFTNFEQSIDKLLTGKTEHE